MSTAGAIDVILAALAALLLPAGVVVLLIARSRRAPDGVSPEYGPERGNHEDRPRPRGECTV